MEHDQSRLKTRGSLVCRVCKQEKPVELFMFLKCKNRYERLCKCCQKERSHQIYLRKKAYYCNYSKVWAKNNREKINARAVKKYRENEEHRKKTKDISKYCQISRRQSGKLKEYFKRPEVIIKNREKSRRYYWKNRDKILEKNRPRMMAWFAYCAKNRKIMAATNQVSGQERALKNWSNGIGYGHTSINNLPSGIL